MIVQSPLPFLKNYSMLQLIQTFVSLPVFLDTSCNSVNTGNCGAEKLVRVKPEYWLSVVIGADSNENGYVGNIGFPALVSANWWQSLCRKELSDLELRFVQTPKQVLSS